MKPPPRPSDTKTPKSTPTPRLTPPTPTAAEETVARLAVPLGSPTPGAVLDGIRAIVHAARERQIDAAAADVLLDRARSSLNALAIATTVQPPDDASPGASELASHYAAFADELDGVGIAAQPIARFLRGRAVAVLDDSHRFAPTPGGENPLGLSSESPPALERARGRLLALRERAQRRARLVAKGADLAQGGDEAWAKTLELAEHELVVLWDLAISSRMRAPVAAGVDDVAVFVHQLKPALVELEDVEKRLRELGRGQRFRVQLLGPRMREILRAVFSARGGTPRRSVLSSITAMQRLMIESNLGDVIEPTEWVEVVAKALLDTEVTPSLPPGTEPSAEAFEELRRGEHRTSNTVTLAEVALHSSPAFGVPLEGPEAAERKVAEVLSALPTEQRTALVRHDLARIERALGLLEAWWSRLGPERASMSDLRHSRFVKVVWEDGALLRFALEARVIATFFTAEASEANAQVARAEALHAAVRGCVDALQRALADAAWANLLGPR